MRNKILFLILFPLLLLLVNCKSSMHYHTIDFKNPYKFNSEILEKLEKDTLDWKYQISAGEYALKGDYKNALEQWDLAFNGKNKSLSAKQIDSINSEYTILSAKEFIIEQSQKHQVLIINEAHHNSSHRVFMTTLLKELYDQGYKNLGLETLENGKNSDSLLNIRGYPVQESGYYSKDPQFGNLIRTALKIGYTLFPYEQTSHEDGKPREIAQAKNIQEIIEERPNEKFLIYCGFAHVLEGEIPEWEKAMAGRLKEFTGIDPLTINQTKYSERSKPGFNDPMLKALNIKTPSVLVDKNGNPFKYNRDESYADLAVFHPNTNYINSRPNWIFTLEKRDVAIDLKDVNLLFPVMILAYLNDEDIHTAIPLDIIELQHSSEMGHLALKKGNYNIVVTNRKKKSLSFKLKVK